MRRQVWCKILYGPNKPNAGPMYQVDEKYSLDDMLAWIRRNYSGYDKLEVHEKEKEVWLIYNNYCNFFRGDRYEIFYFKGAKNNGKA